VDQDQEGEANTMKVIIMGCGRVGEQLSLMMAGEGHDVVVIDQDQTALDRLPAAFPGQKIKGVGFDRAVLVRAGIEQAEGFTSTSSSDNANIVAARIARNVFRVPRVVARLHNPRRAEIYRRLGLLTISSTTWGARRISELLTHADLAPVVSFGSGEVSLLDVELPPSFAGRTVKDLFVAGEVMVAAITRDGHAVMPSLGFELAAHDTLHLVVLSSAMSRLEAFLDLGGGGSRRL
jgi:trk system potassium uptake protein